MTQIQQRWITSLLAKIVSISFTSCNLQLSRYDTLVLCCTPSIIGKCPIFYFILCSIFFIGLDFDRPLHCSLRRHFQWENSFQQITWQQLVQSLCNFFIKRMPYFGHFWPSMAKKCFVFLREFFFVWGKILQGLISTTRGTFEPKTHTGSHL